jgi:hypothetical protein
MSFFQLTELNIAIVYFAKLLKGASSELDFLTTDFL